MKQRLDKYVTLKLPEVSRARIIKAIKEGLILVDNKKVKPSFMLSGKEMVVFDEKGLTETKMPKPEKLDLPIVYEDEAVIVIDKPAGVVVHPSVGGQHLSGTVVNFVLDKIGKNAGGDELRPGIVHRLDKETSGLLIIAKNVEALENLQKQFKERSVKKFYQALVIGVPEEKEAVIDAPLARLNRDPKRVAIAYGGTGKSAVTSYKIEKIFQASGQKFTLLQIQIFTGRTHQIRVHLSSIGHPVFGDRLYSKSKYDFVEVPRQLLHASRLCFKSPATGKVVELESPLPNDFVKVIEQLR